MADPKKLKVFLSHASLDKPFVRRINEDLKTRDIETWLDEQDIPPGGSIPQLIQDGLVGADVMLVFLSAASVTSRWVSGEWQSHLFRQLSGHHVVIVPLLIDDCEIPPFLADKKYIDFRRQEDFETSLSRLLSYLESIRASRSSSKSTKEYMRSSSILEITKEILTDLASEQISMPMNGRMPIIQTLKKLPRSGKKVRLENFSPKVRIRSIYDHLVSMAHVADTLLPHINHGVPATERSDIAVCIAYHEINEVVLGDIPTYTSLSSDRRNKARIYAEERLRTILPQDRERIANEFIRMFLSDKHRHAFDNANKILSNPKSPATIAFKSLDKIDPIIATWRYLHHFRGELGKTPRAFNSVMKDFFENPDVKSYLRAARVDAKLIDLVLTLQDRAKAWDYYEDPSRIFDHSSLFKIPSAAVREAIEGIPLFCSGPSRRRRRHGTARASRS